MFGTLPAYGIYLRHIKGLTFEDVTLETSAPDLRPALDGEDVENFEIANFRAAGSGPSPLLRLRDARQVYVHGCRPLGDVSLFLTVEGHASREILLQANNLHQAVQAYTLADGAPVNAIIND